MPRSKADKAAATAAAEAAAAATAAAEAAAAATKALKEPKAKAKKSTKQPPPPAADSESEQEESPERPTTSNGKKAKGQTRKKAVKPDGAPKRPLSAYFIWLGENRSRIAEAHKEEGQKAVVKHAGEEWRALSEAEKAPFVKRAEEAKAVYKEQMAAFKDS